MEPVDVTALPPGALLLMDSGPIIHLLERHPKLASVCRPVFVAHDAGRVRFAVTTATLA